ncbi:MAG: TfoX/Sxy family protein [Fimbriimonadales bacterium]
MGFSPEYRERVEAQLSKVVPIRTKAMFGGVGIYSDERFFALIAEDKLYFKVGDLNREDYEKAGMEPFFPFDSPTPMGYYELPESVFKRQKELAAWVEKSLAVADAKKNSKKTQTNRKRG